MAIRSDFIYFELRLLSKLKIQIMGKESPEIRIFIKVDESTRTMGKL